MNAVVAEKRKPLKIDLGCGKNKREGFTGVDRLKMPGVDVVANLLGTWPWDDSSVDEVHMSHTLEHFTGVERVYIFNEMWRVIVPDGKATIITPHWCSNRAYGDYTHQWPPVGEMFYCYLDKKWRAEHAPHNDIEWDPLGYTCDFTFTHGYALRPDIITRNSEYQVFAATNFKEVCQDLHVTLTARK